MRNANIFEEPKFAETSDDDSVVCPYCGHASERESVREDDRIETCDECEKKYHRHESITVTTWCKPDCELNDEQHQWARHDHGDRVFIICDGCGKYSLALLGAEKP